MTQEEIIELIRSMYDYEAQGDGRAADEAGVKNRALYNLARKIDPTFSWN